MPANKLSCPGLFVTGTDTGVGKTVVASAIAHWLQQKGLRVGVMKPAETGVNDPAGLGPDATLLRWASGTDSSAEDICPYRFKAPMSPDSAAKREGIRIEIDRLMLTARSLSEAHDFMIIEGAGGLMVPLSGGWLVADFALMTGLALLSVARPDLGTINHSVLTAFAARQLEIPQAGIMINAMPKDPDMAMQDAPHAISSLAGVDLLGVLPEVEGDNKEKVRQISALLESQSLLPHIIRSYGLDL